VTIHEVPVVSESDDVFRRIETRIARDLSPEALDRTITPKTGDHTLNPWTIPADFLVAARPAAVLVGLVKRGRDVNVLLTQRTRDLRDHAGQIAFPGGKMDRGDLTPAATAIREAGEEIALPAHAIEVLGYLEAYLTRTGFWIVPVIARIVPPFELVINPAEVAEVFEVPFDYLMDAANHRLRQREWLGLPRSFYTIEHGDRTIWGITAGILRVLYEKLYL
jgi:8-oxo-dGTP pyrophosphatase MutT (NUDIX family)